MSVKYDFMIIRSNLYFINPERKILYCVESQQKLVKSSFLNILLKTVKKYLFGVEQHISERNKTQEKPNLREKLQEATREKTTKWALQLGINFGN